MPGLSIRLAAPERPRRMSPSPPAVSLFRPEALAEQSSQFLGSVRIASSLRGIAVALLAVALTVISGAYYFIMARRRLFEGRVPAPDVTGDP